MKRATFKFEMSVDLQEFEIEYDDETYIYDDGKFKRVVTDEDVTEHYETVNNKELIEELMKELKQSVIDRLYSDVDDIITECVKYNQQLDGVITFE